MQPARNVPVCSPIGSVKKYPVIPAWAPLDAHYYVYVLKLEDNCYYIGRTSMPEERLRYLFNQNKSAPQFVRKHRPIQVTEDFYIFGYHEAEHFKNDLTAWYTRCYGAVNVRGGDFVPADPSETWILAMQERSKNATMGYWRLEYF